MISVLFDTHLKYSQLHCLASHYIHLWNSTLHCCMTIASSGKLVFPGGFWEYHHRFCINHPILSSTSLREDFPHKSPITSKFTGSVNVYDHSSLLFSHVSPSLLSSTRSIRSPQVFANSVSDNCSCTNLTWFNLSSLANLPPPPPFSIVSLVPFVAGIKVTTEHS